MIKIEAIVRKEKYEDVKEALSKIQVSGMTVYEVMGCGAQGGYTELVRANTIAINMLPKIKFEIVVTDEQWENKVIETITEVAYTGSNGDGKIFSYDLRNVVRIRTKETGTDAIN